MKRMIALICVLAGIAAAQKDPRPLQKVTRGVIQNGDEKCDPFFLFTVYGGTTVPHVIYWYLKADNSVEHESAPLEYVDVVFDENADPPTTHTLSGSGGEHKVIFTMTSNEYNRSKRCLPEHKTP